MLKLSATLKIISLPNNSIFAIKTTIKRVTPLSTSGVLSVLSKRLSSIVISLIGCNNKTKITSENKNRVLQ